jgi:TonB family protein
VFAFSLSLVLHLTFAIFVASLATREAATPPLEIAIFEGPKGPASPPPGENSAAPGRVAPAPEEAARVEAPKAPPAPNVLPPRVAHPRAVSKPVPVARAAQLGVLAARKQNAPAPATRSFEGAESSIGPRQAPTDTETTGATLGAARSQADVSAGAEVAPSGSAPSGSHASAVGSATLPGPGGSGNGWNSGAGGAGSGGGGNGRGGFSVSGAGAGGAGRSYASIWEWTRRYLPGLRSAYDDELRNDATLRGVILVRYEILTSGAVGDVTIVSSQMHDPHLEQQVLQQIRGWHYPPEPSGTVVVTWPFAFRPSS